MSWNLLLLIFILLTQSVFGADVPEGGEETNRFMGEMMNMVFALGLILVLLFGATWALKKYLNGRVHDLNLTSSIKILETRALSQKSVLHVVQINDKMILVGESPTNLEKLAEFAVDDNGNSFKEILDRK